MPVEDVLGSFGGTRVVPPCLAAVVLLSVVLSGVALGHQAPAAVPTVGVETRTDPPEEADWAFTGDELTRGEPLDEVVRGQPFRVGCSYDDLDTTKPLTVQANVRESPQGDYLNGHVTIERESSLGIGGTVSGNRGVQWFLFTVPRDSDGVFADHDPFWVECMVREQIGTRQDDRGGLVPVYRNVTNDTKRVDLVRTTVYVREPVEARIAEGAELRIEYYGWKSVSRKRVVTRLLADGTVVDRGSINGTVDELSVVPSGHVDVGPSGDLSLDLAIESVISDPSTFDDDEVIDEKWGPRTVHVNTFPRVDVLQPTRRTFSVDRSVTFRAEAVDYDDEPGDDDRIEYRWDFGDGTSDVGQEVVHEYDRAGEYDATLTVEDGEGHTVKTTLSLDIRNEAPNVSIDVSPDSDLHVYDEIRFRADAVDPEGSELDYIWDFDDDTPTDSRREVSHVYERAGEYDVTLTVSEEDGDMQQVTVEYPITVANDPPTVDLRLLSADTTGVGSEVGLRADASDREDERRGLELTYVWDFDDDTRPAEDEVYHTFDEVGTYTVGVTVLDSLGRSATDSVDIEVVNAAPEVRDIVVSPGSEVFVDQPIELRALASDPEGAVLTYNWRLGNGDLAHAEVIEYVYEEVGTYEVTLTVADELGKQTVQRTKVTVANAKPEIIDMSEPRPVSGGDIIAGKAVRFSAHAEDPDEGSPVRYEWDFGDGSGGNNAEVEHTFERAGTYDVVLEVIDDEGGVTEQDITVEVRKPTIVERVTSLTLDESIAVAGLLFGVLTWLFRGRIGRLIAPLGERLRQRTAGSKDQPRQRRRKD